MVLPSAPATRPDSDYTANSSPFSADGQIFRDLGHRLVETLAPCLARRPGEPVYRPFPPEIQWELDEMLIPERGMALDGILANFTRAVLPYGRGQDHPRFAAFIGPAASRFSMLAAIASAVTNTSGAGGDYAAIYVARAFLAGTTIRGRFALRSCALHYDLDEEHGRATVAAVRHAAVAVATPRRAERSAGCVS